MQQLPDEHKKEKEIPLGPRLKENPIKGMQGRTYMEKLSPAEKQKAVEILNQMPPWVRKILAEFVDQLPEEQKKETAAIIERVASGIANSREPKATILHILEEVKKEEKELPN